MSSNQSLAERPSLTNLAAENHLNNVWAFGRYRQDTTSEAGPEEGSPGNPEALDQSGEAASEELPLSDKHRQMLEEESAITPEVIAARGYTTVYEPEELRKMGFAEYQLRAPALAIPISDVFGEFRFHRIRPDDPRPDRRKPGKVVKYEQPPDTPLVIDVSPAALEGLKDTSRKLWIVEGEKKADALVSQGECAIALLGVWAWKRDGYPLPDWDQIPMIGREVRILFDSDTADKVEVKHAFYSLSRFIKRKVHGS